jgi:hypothetical protein
MRALEAYRNIRRELDQTASPTFNVNDFNYHFNATILDYITINYAGLDLRQKENDDLRTVIEFDKELVTMNGVGILPEDYKHMLGMQVQAKFKEQVDEFAKDQVVLFKSVERQLTAARGIENAYKEPSHNRRFYRLAGASVYIDMGNKVTVEKIFVDFVKRAATVYLNPDSNTDFSLEQNNKTIPFAEDTCLELVRLCALNLMENTGNRRLPTARQQQQLRQE